MGSLIWSAWNNGLGLKTCQGGQKKIKINFNFVRSKKELYNYF